MEQMFVNGKPYRVISLLGHGKGGYSYLAVDDAGKQYVIKQIHHEPCDYYQFGDKLQSELRDYQRLREIGIPIPALLDVDALKASENQEAAIEAALEDLKKDSRYLFDGEVPPPYARGTGAFGGQQEKHPTTLAGALREKFERK